MKPDLFLQDEEARGYMKASPDGKRIACAVYSTKRPFDLFDFDAATGRLSNYVNLGLVRGQYGLSFSPDNSKLYVTSDDRPEPGLYPYPDVILQFDLNAGDVNAIIRSRRSVVRDNPDAIPGNGIFDGFLLVEKGLQLGMDGRLYATADYAYHPSDGGIMVVIEKPNETGFDCRINYRRFDFGEGKTGTGLPNFLQSYFNGIQSASTCAEPASVSIYPNPTTNAITIRMIEGYLSPVRLQIINALGQHVSTIILEDHKAEVDITHIGPGVYIFIVSSVYNKKVVKKIVKL
jgi:hypothetical protein